MKRGEGEASLLEFRRGFEAALGARKSKGSSDLPLIAGGGLLVVVALGLVAVVLPIVVVLVLAVFVATIVYGAAELGVRSARGFVSRGRSFDNCPLPRREAIAARRGSSGLEQILLDALLTEYRRAHGDTPPPDLTEQEAMELRLGYLAPAMGQKALAMLVMQQIGTSLHRMLVDEHQAACEWAERVIELRQPRRRNFWLTQRLFSVLSLSKFGVKQEDIFAKETVDDLVRDAEKFRRFLWRVIGSSHVLALEELLHDALPPPAELLPLPAIVNVNPHSADRHVSQFVDAHSTSSATEDPKDVAVELTNRIQRELKCDSELWGDGAEAFLDQARQALEDVALPQHPQPHAVKRLMIIVARALTRVASFDAVFEAILDRPDGCWPEWLGDAIRAATDSPAYADVEAAWPVVMRNARRLFCTMEDEPDVPQPAVFGDEPDNGRGLDGDVNGSDLVAENKSATTVAPMVSHDAARDLGF